MIKQSQKYPIINKIDNKDSSVGQMSIHHTDAIIFMGFVDKEGKMLPEHNQIPLEAAKEQPHFFVVVSTCQVTLSFGDH